MNFTTSPFERMMKETPHPGWDNDDPCRGCRYYKECKGKKRQCRNASGPIVEPALRASVARSLKCLPEANP